MLLRIVTISALAAASIALSASAMAQQSGVYKARLSPSGKNIGPCSNVDGALGREQTLTVAGGKASVNSAGGLKGNLVAIGTDKYQANDFGMGTVQLTVTADLSVKPPLMYVTDNSFGCRWQGALTK
jgi:hypothetical protein